MRRRDENPNPGPIGNLSDSVGQEWLWLHCRSCYTATKHDPLDILERLGRDITMADLIARAICARCGARNAQVTGQPPNHPDRSDAPRRRQDKDAAQG